MSNSSTYLKFPLDTNFSKAYDSIREKQFHIKGGKSMTQKWLKKLWLCLIFLLCYYGLNFEVINAGEKKTDETNAIIKILTEWKDRYGNEGRWEEEVRAIAFSPDGKTLVSLGPTQYPILWDIATGEGREFRAVFGSSQIMFSPDGKMLVVAASSGPVHIFDITTGDSFRHFSGEYPFSFSPDGKTLVTKSYGSSILQWDIETREMIHQFTTGTPGSDSGGASAFSPDGKILAFTAIDDKAKNIHESDVVILWDLVNSKKIKTIPYKHKRREIKLLTFSYDGKILASNTGDIWDIKTGKELLKLFDSEKSLWKDTYFHPKEKILAILLDDTIVFLDIAKLKVKKRLKNCESPIAFSPDGKILAVRSSDSIVLYDFEQLLKTTNKKK